MVSLDSRVGELVQDVAELRGLLEAANRPKVRMQCVGILDFPFYQLF